MPDPHAPTDRLASPTPPEAETDDLGDQMRRLLRRMASPVTVVTCWADGKPQGATIGSFASLSLRPALVSFNVQRQGRFHAAVTSAPRFAVHALTADQADLADRFASSDDDVSDLFAEVIPGTPPLLSETQGILVCQPFAQHVTGDHTLLIGQVIRVVPGADAAPLLYHGRRYLTVGSG